MYLCAAPDYLQRRGVPERIGDLAHHECLAGTSDTWVFDEGGTERLVRPHGRWRCNSGLAVLDAALRGAGICQLPDYYVREHLRAGRLVALLQSHQPPNTAVWAVYPQQRHLAARVRLLIEHLKAGLAERPEYR
jgi:DNA-binding transcriptional LysR family regulator